MKDDWATTVICIGAIQWPFVTISAANKNVSDDVT